ncbi:unnamed protein product [Clonostachys rosea f. rosea IK726]|uniref:Uncharacterized protein n=1 Tax=Clonostachys rosea f. rosea IK726 TaxID=1349383 RepID=A0ACA9TP36_BIOOC|nr:unnamed protein product [Clonostachys rosea f. rosea IK726]
MDRAIATRSRTGCTNCRKGRIRCDEKKPDCTTCLAKKKTCSYSPARLPLRDRRAQAFPGEQTPWALPISHPHQIYLSAKKEPNSKKKKQPTEKETMIRRWKLPRSDAVDPFNVLLIKMPFNSKELLHYSVGRFSGLPSHQINACVGSAVKTPVALRNTLIIAGVHHVWNTGELRSFKSAFLSHKLHGVHQVNGWLQRTPDTATFFKCCQLIATLCITECCVKNFAVADAHLAGLLAYMDHFSATKPGFDLAQSIEGELLNRYFILAFNIMHGLKSQVNDFIRMIPKSSDPQRTIDKKKLRDMIYNAHTDEEERLSRLKGVSLFPFFFLPLEAIKKPFRHIDVSTMLESLRDVTKAYDMRFKRPSRDGIVDSLYHLWYSGAPSKMFVASIDAHAKSISHNLDPSTQGNVSLLSSWSGFNVAEGMYLTSVLGIWNSGSPPETPLHTRGLLILEKDLQAELVDFDTRREQEQALWLWKLFVGILSIAHADVQSRKSIFQELSARFSQIIRRWIDLREMGSMQWENARELLSSITWPVHFQKEEIARRLWSSAILGDEQVAVSSISQHVRKK